MDKLLILDCDGVLVDSEHITSRVRVDMLAEMGMQMTVEESLALFKGGHMAKSSQILEQKFRRKLPDDFIAQFRKRMNAALAAEMEAVDGVLEALDKIDWPMCVASSGPQSKMRVTLGKIGVLERFAGRIFSAYDIQKWKPDPSLFLHAAATLNVPPEKCVVVEDSLLGIEAGVTAGMQVFGYAAAGSSNKMEAAGARAFTDMRLLPKMLNEIHTSD